MRKHFYLPVRRNYELPSMAGKLDLVIFGATGFTGKHCIPPVIKLSKAHGRNLTWGVAGRSEEGLKKVLEEVGKKIGEDLKSIPVIKADVKDEISLKAMAQKAKVVINCCGPYRFLGEPVVKACVEVGTSHVDVSGEPEYMEEMQLNYNKEAAEKGIYIVSACGFDSIPCDLGIIYLQQNFEGTLNSVETYLKGWTEGKASGSTINYGTWHSIIYGLARENELKALRRKLFPNPLPNFEPKLEANPRPYKVDLEEGWMIPFLGSDKAVARRTQRYLYEVEAKRPIQVESYQTVGSIFNLMLMGISGIIFLVLTKFSYGRSLLLKHPKFFTAGYFSHENPSEETINNSWFRITFYGEGWKEKLLNSDDQYKKPVDKCIIGKVTGRNPGYGATCIAVVLSAIMIITEPEKLPKSGGVYSPGAAFGKTSIIEELIENEIKFEIVSQKDL